MICRNNRKIRCFNNVEFHYCKILSIEINVICKSVELEVLGVKKLMRY